MDKYEGVDQEIGVSLDPLNNLPTVNSQEKTKSRVKCIILLICIIAIVLGTLVSIIVIPSVAKQTGDSCDYIPLPTSGIISQNYASRSWNWELDDHSIKFVHRCATWNVREDVDIYYKDHLVGRSSSDRRTSQSTETFINDCHNNKEFKMISVKKNKQTISMEGRAVQVIFYDAYDNIIAYVGIGDKLDENIQITEYGTDNPLVSLTRNNGGIIQEDWDMTIYNTTNPAVDFRLIGTVVGLYTFSGGFMEYSDMCNIYFDIVSFIWCLIGLAVFCCILLCMAKQWDDLKARCRNKRVANEIQS
jgi:hypothetical protein